MTTLAGVCSGVGGLELGIMGIHSTPLTHLWNCENAEDARTVLRHRFPAVTNHENLITHDWANTIAPQILCAGLPCQPYAVGGKGLGAKDPRHLFPHFVSAIDRMRGTPELIVLENSPQIVSISEGRVWEDILGALMDRGYGVTWCLADASSIGAPHRRRRMFLVARHGGRLLGKMQPEPTRPHKGRLFPTPEAKLWKSGPDYARAARPNSGGHDLTTTAALISKGLLDENLFRQAVTHWERVTGFPAPPMVRDGVDRVSELFAEWMMGVSPGWITGVPGIGIADALRLIGNMVVPAQAGYAIRHLLKASE